jgi:hypothetical protein
VLNEGEPVYRVVEPGPTKVNLNQLVIGKVLRKEGRKYYQIGPHSNRLPLPLPIKLDPKDLSTWADPTMYHQAANLVPPASPQPQTPQSTRQTPQPSHQGEITNQMLYEQMVQMNGWMGDMDRRVHHMYGWMGDMDRRVQDVWNLTQHINDWHINRRDYQQPQFPAYQVDPRWFPQAPQAPHGGDEPPPTD